MKIFKRFMSIAALSLMICSAVLPSEVMAAETKKAEIVKVAKESDYTFTEIEATGVATTGVNLRALPCVDGKRLGGLKKGNEVQVVAQCKETGWYKIIKNKKTYYVCNDYIELKDVKKTETKKEATGTGTSVPLTGPIIIIEVL